MTTVYQKQPDFSYYDGKYFIWWKNYREGKTGIHHRQKRREGAANAPSRFQRDDKETNRLYGFSFLFLILGNTGYPWNKPAPLIIFPDNQQRAGIADWTVGTGNDTDKEDKDEVMNSGTAEQEQCEKNENNGKRGVQRPDEGFVDAEIHCFLEIFIEALGHIFSIRSKTTMVSCTL